MEAQLQLGKYACPEEGCKFAAETPGQLGGHVTWCRRQRQEKADLEKRLVAKRAPSDDERLDPSNVRAWYCTAGTRFTVVLATCQGEAQGAAAFWFAKAGLSVSSERRFGEVAISDIRARPASESEVERWKQARAQTKAEARVA